jgi:hypothetical protein
MMLGVDYRLSEESKGSEPIIEFHDDHIALRYNLARIAIVVLAGDKAVSVNSDHDRTAAVLSRVPHLGKYTQI